MIKTWNCKGNFQDSDTNELVASEIFQKVIDTVFLLFDLTETEVTDESL